MTTGNSKNKYNPVIRDTSISSDLLTGLSNNHVRILVRIVLPSPLQDTIRNVISSPLQDTRQDISPRRVSVNFLPSNQ
jgi:hypothetical protein